MTTLVYLAAPLRQGDVVPQLDLRAEAPLPDGLTLEQTRRYMSDDARVIVDALVASLPQGTVDRIFALLAQKLCTDLVVRMDA